MASPLFLCSSCCLGLLRLLPPACLPRTTGPMITSCGSRDRQSCRCWSILLIGCHLAFFPWWRDTWSGKLAKETWPEVFQVGKSSIDYKVVSPPLVIMGPTSSVSSIGLGLQSTWLLNHWYLLITSLGCDACSSPLDMQESWRVLIGGSHSTSRARFFWVIAHK